MKKRGEIDCVGIWVVERLSSASLGTVVLDGPIVVVRSARAYVV